jgi:hypothetical protein
MGFSDSSNCPWKGREHVKMADVPSRFLRWAIAERPEMVDRHPGLREYIATRIGAQGVVRSQTREAREVPERSRREGSPRPKPAAVATPKAAAAFAPEPAARQGDFFDLARAMREAVEGSDL